VRSCEVAFIHPICRPSPPHRKMYPSLSACAAQRRWGAQCSTSTPTPQRWIGLLLSSRAALPTQQPSTATVSCMHTTTHTHTHITHYSLLSQTHILTSQCFSWRSRPRGLAAGSAAGAAQVSFHSFIHSCIHLPLSSPPTQTASENLYFSFLWNSQAPQDSTFQEMVKLNFAVPVAVVQACNENGGSFVVAHTTPRGPLAYRGLTSLHTSQGCRVPS
jgi:hypothetical protein